MVESEVEGKKTTRLLGDMGINQGNSFRGDKSRLDDQISKKGVPQVVN